MMDYFAGLPGTVPHPERDLVHFITSDYRPPAAVVALTRKDHAKPLEIFASHPHYQNFLPQNQGAPKYHETTYIAHHFQMGSLVEGGAYGVNGLKIPVDDGKENMVYVVPSSQPKGNICTNRNANDRIAQNRNLVVMVTPQPRKNFATWNTLLPLDIKIEDTGKVTFVDNGKVWLAFHWGANAQRGKDDAKRIQKFKSGKSKTKGTILGGEAPGEGFSAIGIEVGEAQSHGSYEAFKKAVLGASKFESSNIAKGEVALTGSQGRQVGISWAPKVKSILRNGKQHTPTKDLWSAPEGEPEVVSLGWNTGTLKVKAGGHSFEGQFDLEKGTYSFTQSLGK